MEEWAAARRLRRAWWRIRRRSSWRRVLGRRFSRRVWAWPFYPGHYPYYPGRYPYYPGRYPWWGYRGYYGNGWYGYPWASWGWYGGVGWSGAYNQSGWYSDPVTQYPVYVYANPDNGNTTYNQQQEIDRLNDEVARLRAEREPGSAATPVPQPSPKTQIRAATVLVFRDRHTEEIQDYAIVGKTLWVFTEQRARKIPIADAGCARHHQSQRRQGY